MKPVLTINYVLWSAGGDCPPHGVLQFRSDYAPNDPAHGIHDLNEVLSVPATRYSDANAGVQFAIDDGKGSEDGGAGSFGQCIIPLTGLFWVHYVDDEPPDEPWVTEVGPVDGEWYMDDTGGGYLYAGLHEPDNQRILVMQLAGGGGGGRYGIAAGYIAPADSHLTGSSFAFLMLRPDDSVTPQTYPKTLVADTEATNGINRYTHISGADGSFVQVHKVNGEWTLLTIEDVCPE